MKQRIKDLCRKAQKKQDILQLQYPDPSSLIVPGVFTAMALAFDIAALIRPGAGINVAIIATGYAVIAWVLYWAIFLSPKD